MSLKDWKWAPEVRDGYEGVSVVACVWDGESVRVRENFTRFTDLPDGDSLPGAADAPVVREALADYQRRSAERLQALAREAREELAS